MLALARSGNAATSDMRFGLERTNPIVSMLRAFQAAAAASIAASERHGDRGAGVLRHTTGVSRRQAESHVKTSEVLESMPAVREALETGKVSFANASRLAQAGEKAGTGAVEADRVLMSKAESMPEAKRSATAAQHQALISRDGGCSGCRANPALCDDHHVRPVSEGGPTDISNMTLLCWDCHNKVHHHDWRVVPRGDGRFDVEPPSRIRHGPATAPERPPPRHSPRAPTRAAGPVRRRARAPDPALFP